MSEVLTVLLIDDEPDVLITFSEYLDGCGYQVMTALDGETGLTMFEQSAPDVVVTDLRMPGLDGFQVIRAIKSRSPHTAVIVLTGTGESHVTEQVTDLGAFCCLYKPLHNLNDLVVAIELAHGT